MPSSIRIYDMLVLVGWVELDPDILLGSPPRKKKNIYLRHIGGADQQISSP